MIIVFYGSKRTVIDLGEYFVKCPSCHTHQWADVMVYSVYNHIYGIPIVPTGKEAFVVCHECGLKRDKEYFDSTLVSNYEEIKSKFRHPFYTYTGVTLFTLTAIVVAIHYIHK